MVSNSRTGGDFWEVEACFGNRCRNKRAYTVDAEQAKRFVNIKCCLYRELFVAGVVPFGSIDSLFFIAIICKPIIWRWII